MPDPEIAKAVREALAETKVQAQVHVHDIVRTAVTQTLVSLGMDASDPLKLQQDMHYLREKRQSEERIRSKIALVLIALGITSAVGAMWVGLKVALGD
jgi:predicted deacetylase